MSTSPHDALFKDVYGKPEHAAGALRAVVPAVLGEALDWSTLTRCPGSFIDPALSERHTDLLFSASWRGGGDALVYVVFEHQSSPDPQMAFRLLRYLVRIWERWWAEHAAARAIPVVLPVVLYHGAAPWSVPLSFGALLDVPDAVRPALAPHLVELSYLLDDLSTVPDARLRGRAMTALGKLAALSFKHARSSPDLLARLASWSDVMREVAGAPNGLEALAIVMRYNLLVNDRLEPEALYALVEREVSPQAKDATVTAGERLIEQGLQQGLQQGLELGRQQGIEQGAQQGKRDVLLSLLRQRFADQVTASAERRVAAAAPAELDAWIGRVLTVGTLAELLAH